MTRDGLVLICICLRGACLLLLRYHACELTIRLSQLKTVDQYAQGLNNSIQHAGVRYSASSTEVI